MSLDTVRTMWCFSGWGSPKPTQTLFRSYRWRQAWKGPLAMRRNRDAQAYYPRDEGRETHKSFTSYHRRLSLILIISRPSLLCKDAALQDSGTASSIQYSWRIVILCHSAAVFLQCSVCNIYHLFIPHCEKNTTEGRHASKRSRSAQFSSSRFRLRQHRSIPSGGYGGGRRSSRSGSGSIRWLLLLVPFLFFVVSAFSRLVRFVANDPFLGYSSASSVRMNSTTTIAFHRFGMFSCSRISAIYTCWTRLLRWWCPII